MTIRTLFIAIAFTTPLAACGGSGSVQPVYPHGFVPATYVDGYAAQGVGGYVSPYALQPGTVTTTTDISGSPRVEGGGY